MYIQNAKQRNFNDVHEFNQFRLVARFFYKYCIYVHCICTSTRILVRCIRSFYPRQVRLYLERAFNHRRQTPSGFNSEEYRFGRGAKLQKVLNLERLTLIFLQENKICGDMPIRTHWRPMHRNTLAANEYNHYHIGRQGRNQTIGRREAKRGNRKYFLNF